MTDIRLRAPPSSLHSFHSAAGRHCLPREGVSSTQLLLRRAINEEQHRTDELLPHLVSLSQILRAEDQRVDDAEECDHVRDVVGGLQLVHDHAEAVLLRLHALRGGQGALAVLAQGNPPRRDFAQIDSTRRLVNTDSSALSSTNSAEQTPPLTEFCRACLVVIQGVQRQPMTLRGEDAERGQQLKQLLLHHRVGRVQRCRAGDLAVRIRRHCVHLFPDNHALLCRSGR